MGPAVGQGVGSATGLPPPWESESGGELEFEKFAWESGNNYLGVCCGNPSGQIRNRATAQGSASLSGNNTRAGLKCLPTKIKALYFFTRTALSTHQLQNTRNTRADRIPSVIAKRKRKKRGESASILSSEGPQVAKYECGRLMVVGLSWTHQGASFALDTIVKNDHATHTCPPKLASTFISVPSSSYFLSSSSLGRGRARCDSTTPQPLSDSHSQVKCGY